MSMHSDDFFLPVLLGAESKKKKKNRPKKYATGGIWLPNLNIWRWKFSHDFLCSPCQVTHKAERHAAFRVTIKDEGLAQRRRRQKTRSWKKSGFFCLISMRKRFLAEASRVPGQKDGKDGLIYAQHVRGSDAASCPQRVEALILSQDIAPHLHTWSRRRRRVRLAGREGQTSFFIYPPQKK